MTKSQKENELDLCKRLNNITAASHAALERIQEAIDKFFERDVEARENQLDSLSVVLTLIPSVNERLSESARLLPTENLNGDCICTIKKDPRIRAQHKKSLSVVLLILAKVISVIKNKSDLLAINELLKHLYAIGLTLIQVYPRDKQLAQLVGAVKDNISLIKMEVSNCHE